MWSIRTLTKVCAYGTFGMVGLVLCVREEVQGRIRRSTCYIEAFKYLHDNKGAIKYFGEPLNAGYVTNIDQSEDQNDSVYWYKVPLRGPNGKGLLYYKTVKDPTWFLSRVELELDKLPGQKLLIMEKDTSPEVELEAVERESKEIVEEKTINAI